MSDSSFPATSTPPLFSTTSTPPSSSSSSSMHTPSPNLEQRELSSDSSDPLSFLLQSLGETTDNAQDWSSLSSWTHADAKFNELSSDFNFSLPMDLDFDANMAVDPHTLHFSSMMDQSSLGLPPPENSFLMADGDMFFSPAGEQKWHTEFQGGPARRLSVTSSSSSSGASLSPGLDSASVTSSSPPSECNLSDPAQELAQRVREMAGVMLAVPVSAQVQQLAAAGGQSKLPIPRLVRQNSSLAASKRGSPKPDSFTLPSGKVESPGADLTLAPPATSVIGRPKTSHTTIERRYRTNLNARITGLKQAVPALRVLEAKNGGGLNVHNDIVDARGFVDGVKVARKMSKANVLGKATEYIRVLKKREARFRHEQDGLKSLIAGLVGGPALLKEWEREWRMRFGGEEKDEIEDDDADAGSGDEDGDGEDSEGEDGEGRSRKKAKLAKQVKKEKLSRPVLPPLIPATPGVVPEKRKRGRPRKNPLPAVMSALASGGASLPAQPTEPPNFSTTQPVQAALMQPQEGVTAQPAPAQQYLLAVFAFFSVFNTPLMSSTRSHANSSPAAHHGIVLTPHIPAQSQSPTPSVTDMSSYSWHDVVQAVHLLISTLVFFYVIVPWLSGALRATSVRARVSAYFAFHRIWPATADEAKTDSVKSSSEPKPTDDVKSPKSKFYNRAALMDALAPAKRGSEDEATRLRAALSVSDGFIGLLQGVIKAGRVDRGIELNQLEQRAWVRLGELVAFNREVCNTTRVQTYWCMSWHISTFSASATDLSTLALIMRPVSHSKAAALWESAREREIVRADERLALESMSVDDAAEWLEKWRLWHVSERKGRCAACEKRTPLGILAAILIRERLRKHAAALFVRTVVREGRCPAEERDCDGDGEYEYVYDAEKDASEEQERRETISAGKSIGGRTAELAMSLERIWNTGFCSQDLLPPHRPHAYEDADADEDCEDEQDLASTDEAEVRALLSATIAYRRIFPSSIPACSTGVPFVLSPPPSPSQRNAALHMALRTALGSPAFEFGGGRLADEQLGAALEDARDRVVDMLVERERAFRRGGRTSQE
ncbi:hypothetical protein BKA93DRAFT_735272 [Sparassis latifolia]|uniref:BHLH domain-containing protein n=1 Tax=Sparassis crispa TaxID=139825 RepID=A0A401H3W5_9APHY|nr:hypothetical protein SCP_1500940 [Sparassis crispa]GBE89091.1 hypothetical protein SCP_1500940 [Sparassis crispa]